MSWSWNTPRRQIAQSCRRNASTLRKSPLAEVSGALGDLGTLLPLMAALALQGSVSLSSTLVFSGLFNVATGLWFGLPLPVQPMKAIAAAAIAGGREGVGEGHASMGDTVAAGALVSAAVLLLAVTGLMRRLADAVPVPVVKGIQLGAGLSLVMSAGASSLLGGLGWAVHPSVLDNRLWALAAFAGLLATQRQALLLMPAAVAEAAATAATAATAVADAATTVADAAAGSSHTRTHTHAHAHGRPRRQNARPRPLFLPYALVVFAAGVVLALVRIAAWVVEDGDHHYRLPHLSPWQPHVRMPHWQAPAAWSMAVAQLPLTTLNSVVAVSALADELFRSSTSSLSTSVTAFGCSVGAMNLVGCWFGAMPVCHGAGGLAAQHRFGARSGASVALLGVAKLLLGLCFGDTLVDLLRAFPRSLLGVLVLAAGLELAKAAASLNDAAAFSPLQQRERWTVMLMTAACLLAFRNDAVGFLAGLLCHAAYRLGDSLDRRGGVRGLGHDLRRRLRLRLRRAAPTETEPLLA